MDIRREKSKGKSIFYAFYFAFFGTLIIAVLFALFLLWNAMKDYERCVPDTIMTGLVQNINQGNYDKIASGADIKLSEFEDAASVRDYLTKAASGGNISYSKKAIPDNTRLNYVLTSDNKVLANVILAEKSEKSKFGNPQYYIEKITSKMKEPQSIEILAPTTAKVFVNGKEVGSKYISDKAVPVEALKSVPNIFEKPDMVKYKIDGIYFDPVITAKSSFGNDLDVKKDEKTGVHTVSFDGDKTKAESMSPMVIEVAQTYAKYVSHDAKFADLAKYFSKDTPILKKLSGLDVQFYGDHDKYEFKNTKTSEFMMYNENCFSCRITFNHVIYRTSAKKEYNFPSDFTFCFIKKDGKWIVTDMVINS